MTPKQRAVFDVISRSGGALSAAQVLGILKDNGYDAGIKNPTSVLTSLVRLGKLESTRYGDAVLRYGIPTEEGEPAAKPIRPDVKTPKGWIRVNPRTAQPPKGEIDPQDRVFTHMRYVPIPSLRDRGGEPGVVEPIRENNGFTIEFSQIHPCGGVTKLNLGSDFSFRSGKAARAVTHLISRDHQELFFGRTYKAHPFIGLSVEQHAVLRELHGPNDRIDPLDTSYSVDSEGVQTWFPTLHPEYVEPPVVSACVRAVAEMEGKREGLPLALTVGEVVSAAVELFRNNLSLYVASAARQAKGGQGKHAINAYAEKAETALTPLPESLMLGLQGAAQQVFDAGYANKPSVKVFLDMAAKDTLDNSSFNPVVFIRTQLREKGVN